MVGIMKIFSLNFLTILKQTDSLDLSLFNLINDAFPGASLIEQNPFENLDNQHPKLNKCQDGRAGKQTKIPTNFG